MERWKQETEEIGESEEIGKLEKIGESEKMEAPEGLLLYSPKRSYLAVVAIDFGTTYSGCAYSFTADRGKQAIFMDMYGTNACFALTRKTPTCLLLKPDLEFDSFGYEAMEKYSCLQDESEEKEYLFFKHFKMALHSDETLNSRTVIKAANGRSVQAKTVFARSINFLKDEAMKRIRQFTGDDLVSVDEIQWVLTVSAIWTPRAKQFMREAAYEAGVGSAGNADQLMIALEPEAAAIFCKEKNMRDFHGESDDRSLDEMLSQINTPYLVVDIGGGTLQGTVHEIQVDGRIKEIDKVTWGPYGGMYVNQRFESLLDELFGTQMLQSYRKQFPSDWIYIMNDFELKKRGKRILDSSVKTNIQLPRSFLSQIIQTRGKRIDRYAERDVKIKSNHYLSLSSAVMRELFTPVVDSIKEHLDNLLRKPQLAKVQIMHLVGGFAESPFLQEEIKDTFSRRCKVLIPQQASVAVALGAVIFGKEPNIINREGDQHHLT